jgi:DNA-binding HxlR family transcriptional regulator
MSDPAARRDPSPVRRATSPLEAALERVGDRWSLLLVEALLDGGRRFNELAEAMPAIAPNILADRLRRLERERIVVATPYQQHPPRMSYALAAEGRELASALRLLADWGARRSETAEPMHHEACGTSLETRWWCPTCAVAVDDAQAAETRSV